MRDGIERFMSGTLTVAAVVIAIAAARQTFGRPEPPTSERVFIQDWRTVAAEALPDGSRGEAVKIVEFFDLECPACRVYNSKTLAKVREAYPTELSVGFIHYPIQGHQMALPFARGAECARRQGRFTQFIEAVYEGQDSIRTRRPRHFAQLAGVDNLTQFARCAASSEPMPAVDQGLATGVRLGIRGTPTIMVNGCLFKSPPSDTLLRRIVEKMRSNPDANCS